MSLLELFFTAQAWASSATGEPHGPSIHEIWFPLGNFLIFAFIIARYALPPVRSYLRSRREEVVAALEEASAKKRQAEALVQDYRGRLAVVAKEIAEIEAALRGDGEKEKNKLLSEAQTLAASIKDDARFLADQEFKMARQKLREQMASRAEEAARELARRNLSAADQGRLMDDFIQGIGQVR
ncbi:MAG: ATP synthase F0 subunit B [Deltaproteobacteria bacterium]|nr:ATP synthase F0 subunit B [Deltaproteobacteria bacterium]